MSIAPWPLSAAPRDARTFQIAALSGFLAFGMAMRAFPVALTDFALIAATALLAQYAGSLACRVPFEARSALITALSLTLLLRADGPVPLMLAAAVAIGSKFVIRVRGKHVFNPANAGIVALLLLSTSAFPGLAWTTPGQWGAAVWLAAVMAGVGAVVTTRARRLDTPLVFLGTWALLIYARALWLGDPLTIPTLRLQNGALILFAFFMISDPKTTPDDARLRAAFAAATALVAYWLTYHRFLSDGLFYALALMCLVRPLIDLFDRAPRFRWTPPRPSDRPAPAE